HGAPPPAMVAPARVPRPDGPAGRRAAGPHRATGRWGPAVPPSGRPGGHGAPRGGPHRSPGRRWGSVPRAARPRGAGPPGEARLGHLPARPGAGELEQVLGLARGVLDAEDLAVGHLAQGEAHLDLPGEVLVDCLDVVD